MIRFVTLALMIAAAPAGAQSIRAGVPGTDLSTIRQLDIPGAPPRRPLVVIPKTNRGTPIHDGETDSPYGTGYDGTGEEGSPVVEHYTGDTEPVFPGFRGGANTGRCPAGRTITPAGACRVTN
ncbi:hypothetical protein [Jannaschia ovalis]|uniref:Uncharacterized protein n=1 Tax=Jannaschia ovalis TaxID=3038773 RepID=A0ABY8LEG7_9RHOB|nr:hypothetical protein [Jannaschia sp. GRR-S6-38]WGH79699.1 hypothetical protein P8627_05400 [Jannaschia sp. GRR-S6-38]